MNEEQELRDDARAARLLAGLPQPSPAVAQRVRARVAATSSPTVASRGLRLVTVGAVAALAAASVLLAVRRSLEPAPVSPVAVAGALEATGAFAIDTSIPNVALSYEGLGAIAGTSDAPQIRWDTGTLNVEVMPDRGIRLAVETREATVRVVGTGFTVARDVLGTRVEVRHGRVEVDCGAELTRLLEAGDAVTCLPQSAGGLLGRANALRLAGAPPTEVLETLDRALALPEMTPSHADVLAATRIHTLVSMGRNADALSAAQRYLTGPTGVRREEVEKMAGAAAVALGGCSTAAPWLLPIAPAAAEVCGE